MTKSFLDTTGLKYLVGKLDDRYLGKNETASTTETATKAIQDSSGQQINTTYVKGVTGSNATLTVTKGNGSTSSITVNNVANATTANNLVLTGGTSAHIKYGGGDVDENAAISQNKVNLLIGSWYSTGFRDLCSSGTPITVAINHRNGNIKLKVVLLLVVVLKAMRILQVN